MEKLPFMATENIMMLAVKNGGNRQVLHEKLRVHSHAASYGVKMEGKSNDLIDRICNDSDFNLKYEDVEKTLDPKLYTGRCASQTECFVNDVAQPMINKYYIGDVSEQLKV